LNVVGIVAGRIMTLMEEVSLVDLVVSNLNQIGKTDDI